MDEDAVLDVATELLAVRSTADRPGDRRRALDLVLGVVGDGCRTERFGPAHAPSALVYPAETAGAVPAGGDRPWFRVILNAHLDVVPGDPGQFRPRRVGDRLYARGAQDMKVTALAMAATFRELAGTLPYPVGLQLVTDEEVGGYDGTRYQVERGVRGDFVVIGEHSRLDLVVESKGILLVTLRATGRAAHGAYPWLGDNALLKLIRTLGRLTDRYPEPDAEAWRTTVNVARIGTDNTATNQVPARAEARLDVRFPPEDPDFARRSAEEVTAHLSGFAEPGVAVRVDRLDPPHRADPHRREVVELRRAVRAQGFAGDFLRKHGAADTRFYSAVGVDAVVFGIGGDGQHGPDEYADLTTVTPYRRALAAFLTALATS